jgi:hypothetical protein
MSQSIIQISKPAFDTDNISKRCRACIDLYATKAKALTLNNKNIFQQAWKLDLYTNGANNISIPTFPYNSSAGSIVARTSADSPVTYFLKLVNDFEDYNFGIYLSQTTNSGDLNRGLTDTVIGIQPCYIYGTPLDYSDFSTLSAMVPYTYDYTCFITKYPRDYDANVLMNAFKVFSYSGNDISFISAFGLPRTAVFSYMKNISDPTDIKPFFIIFSLKNMNSYCDIYNATTGVQLSSDMKACVFTDNNRFPDVYTSDFNRYSSIEDKLVLYKFTYKGYYCDNLFTYEGQLPYEHFIYDGHEYVHFARNIVAKLS